MLVMNYPRFAFVAIYLVVDVLYVLMSRHIYFDVVKKIQKGDETMMTASRMIAAVAAYAILGAGWMILVAPHIESQKTVTTALTYGAMYGFAVYGVFNFTNHVMFQNYGFKIMLQDVVWGTSWVTVLSVLYALYLSTRQS